MTIDAIAPGGKVLCDVEVSEECSVSELIRDLIMHFNLTMSFQYTLERVGEREKLGPDQTLLEAGVISGDRVQLLPSSTDEYDVLPTPRGIRQRIASWARPRLGPLRALRTRVFVSYSSQDREWLERLRTHVAVLDRRNLIHVWSDDQLQAGADWREGIEGALSQSRVAVLLISPAFLASSYIWSDEMPRILAHSKQGMEILPVIVRPCAWKLEPDLERFQARPVEVVALSAGNEYEVDLRLSNLTYELAARVRDK